MTLVTHAENAEGSSPQFRYECLASSEVGFTSSGNQYNYVYKRIRLWNISTGESVLTLDQPKFEINGVAFTPDSRWLAALARTESSNYGV